MGGVFISYRRDDSAGFAGRLFDTLLGAFPASVIFIDVDGIDAGLDFAEVLDKRLKDCDVFLAVIGRKWLDVGADGGRRIDDPNDYVRAEIAAALQRNIRVIPVLVDGAVMPSQNDLPDALAALTRRNSLEISHARFASDVQRLITVLAAILPKAAPPPSRRSGSIARWAVMAGALILCVAASAFFVTKAWMPGRPVVADGSPPPPAKAAVTPPAESVVAPRKAEEAPTTAQPPRASLPTTKDQPPLDVVAKADLDTNKASVQIRLGPGKVVTRKAWCERLTVYTEFGNYSLVDTRVETRPSGEACILRTEWKDHRTEDKLQAETSPRPRLLNQSLSVLCPETYAYMVKDCAVH